MCLRMDKLLSASHDPIDSQLVAVHTAATCEQAFTRYYWRSLCARCQPPGNEPFSGSIMQTLDLSEHSCRVGYTTKKSLFRGSRERGIQTFRTPIYTCHWYTLWRAVGRGGVPGCKDYCEKKACRQRRHTGGGATSPWLTSLTKTH